MEKIAADIGLILLAAGKSSRLGKPKQLLRFRGETLLRRSVKSALASGCRPVIVVLGANAEMLKKEIEEFNVEIVENLIWENGMGTSIQSGVGALLKNNYDAAGAIIMTCDQPFVSVDLIKQIIKNFQRTNAPIVASSYGETVGVPTFFSRALFPELTALKADSGAKKIICAHRKTVLEIPFEAGATDIDTEEDYLNLIESDNLTAD